MSDSLVCIDVYTVKAGDTLYSIAESYDLPASLLMKVNSISNPYNVDIGARLCIPGTEAELPSADGQDTPQAPACIVHEVASGDTLYLIAKKHGVKLDELMNANPDIDPYNLLIGTRLCVPQ